MKIGLQYSKVPTLVQFLPLLLLSGSPLPSAANLSAFPRAEGLRTEFLKNPQGIDALHPRLTWFMTSTRRGERQTAYQLIVSGSLAELAQNHRSLWNTGKVMSGAPEAEYGGKPLKSGSRCYWKVRIWDGDGRPSSYSEPALWCMGLLQRSDWKAKWITSPILADPANRPRTPIKCYRSELTTDANSRKWISLDLGSIRSIDRIDLSPARPEGLTFDIGTVQFPKRFRVVASDDLDFFDSKILVDQSESDYPEPRDNSCTFNFPPIDARYLRLEVSRLGGWDAHDFGIFLGQFAVFHGKEIVSVGAKVAASDSVENDQWSKKFLVSGKSQVEFGPFPSALNPKVSGVFSPSRTPLLRRDFLLGSSVRRATLFSTARGFYEARLNGQRVGKDLLAPGFTDYHRRISYETYDVTTLLHKGTNTLAALLGYGWYAGHMNLGDNAYLYGYFPQFAAQLEVDLASGHHVTISTDKNWSTTLDGPVRWSDLLDGEACDLRLERPGWDKAGFPSTGWQPAWTQDLGPEQLVAERTPPVRITREIDPVSRKEIRAGVWVYDLGQEIAGWVRVNANGPKGAHIVIRHAEAVKPDGEIDTASLWGTPQRDDYFLAGNGPIKLEPHFTYHGFRYFEVTGLPSATRTDAITAVAIHTDVPEVGSFECSNPLFNRIMTASQWTQRNLMFDVPAGCAARSERLAWTGDIRPCVQSALFSFDTAAFFEKYAADLRDDQKPDGRFTDIAPHAHLTGTDICVGSPGWADAGVSLPWDVYVNTGDRRILADHFEAAKRWVDFIHRHNPDLLWTQARGMDWGDWLSAGRATPKELGATAFFAHSTDLVARMASVLGRSSDAAAYGALFQRIKAAFVARYVSSEGAIRLEAEPEAQGSYALALQFGLLDEPLRSKAVQRLTEVIARDGGHPATGFWSSIELVTALSDQDQNEQASQMVNLTTTPSWGYIVSSGGTTFWEAFDADKKTLSLNHWTHSASAEWLWRYVAGINPDEEHAGYRSFAIHPRPSREVSWCNASYNSVRGKIASYWRQDGTKFSLKVTVPANSTARVFVPTSDAADVTESGGPAARAQGVTLLHSERGVAIYQVDSGVYRFTSLIR